MVTVLGQDLLTIFFFLQTFLIRNLLVICMFACLCEREKNRKTERERECMCAPETACEDQRLGDCLWTFFETWSPPGTRGSQIKWF